MIHLTIPEGSNNLPTGYRYGAHTGSPSNGWSGYYVIRESDGASCTGKLSPESHVEEPTAEEIDAAIAAEAAERNEGVSSGFPNPDPEETSGGWSTCW